MLEDFEKIDTATWRDLIRQELKGNISYENLIRSGYEGISIHPFYTERPSQSTELLVSGEKKNCEICQEYDLSLPIDLLLQSCQLDLQNGVQSLTFTFPVLSLLEPSDFESLFSKEKLDSLLGGLPLTQVPLHWTMNSFSEAFFEKLLDFCKQKGISLTDLKGSVDNDPITWSAFQGFSCEKKLVPTYNLIEKITHFKFE